VKEFPHALFLQNFSVLSLYGKSDFESMLGSRDSGGLS
jgi:hypothetical protein